SRNAATSHFIENPPLAVVEFQRLPKRTGLCADMAKIGNRRGYCLSHCECLVSRAAGECPEWQRGRTVNPLAYAFVGSSPTSPTTRQSIMERSGEAALVGGYSTMVVQQPSKLRMRVRFPLPAPISLTLV